jgi:hypothetical protein
MAQLEVFVFFLYLGSSSSTIILWKFMSRPLEKIPLVFGLLDMDSGSPGGDGPFGTATGAGVHVQVH